MLMAEYIPGMQRAGDMLRVSENGRDGGWMKVTVLYGMRTDLKRLD
jgi:hypothetical protein